MFCIEFIVVDGNVLYVLRTADGRIVRSSFDLSVITSEIDSIGKNWLEASKEKSESGK